MTAPLVSPDPESSKDSSKTKKCFVSRFWVLEILSILGSALLLGGMVIFLQVFDNKPVPDFKSVTHFEVSLNSILALINTACKLLLLFPILKGMMTLSWLWFENQPVDDAELLSKCSKSTTGASKLFMGLKFKHFAILGPLAALFSIAMDPFVQSTLKYRTLATDQPLEYAEIAAASYYNGSHEDESGVEPIIKSMVYSALLDTDETSHAWNEPEYACATGNCTWEGILTLAVCTQCADLSDQLDINCEPDPPRDNSDFEYSGCDASLPNNFSIGGANNSRYNVLAVSANRSPLYFSDDENAIVVQSIFTVEETLSWSKLGLLDYDTVPHYRPSRSSRRYARECKMFPCVQNWTVEFTMTTHLESQDSEEPSTGKSFEMTQTQFGDPIPLGFKATSENISWTYPKSTPIVGHEYSFNLNKKSWQSFRNFVSPLFQGYVGCQADLEWQYDTEGEEAVLSALFFNSVMSTNSVGVCPEPSDQARYEAESDKSLVGRYGDVACGVNAVARALTNGMRSSTWWFTDNQFSPGTTWMLVPWVQVQWFWLSIPVIVWILSVIIIVGTAWKAREVAEIRGLRGVSSRLTNRQGANSMHSDGSMLKLELLRQQRRSAAEMPI